MKIIKILLKLLLILIVAAISPLLILGLGIMKLCNFTPGIFAEQEIKEAATMSLISQLEDLSHRMRVLYTEVPQSDVLLLEDVIKVLKET
jgi:hypothetical protein